MSYDIEGRERRLLKVNSKSVVVQSLIGGEFEVAWRRTLPCPLCGVDVILGASGEHLSPHRLEADGDGAYGSPHRHSYKKKVIV